MVVIFSCSPLSSGGLTPASSNVLCLNLDLVAAADDIKPELAVTNTHICRRSLAGWSMITDYLPLFLFYLHWICLLSAHSWWFI